MSNFSGNKALLVMQECIQLVSRNCQGTFFLFDGKKRNKTAGNFRTFLKRGFCPIVMCPPKPQKLGQLKIAEDISHHKLSCNVTYVCSKWLYSLEFHCEIPKGWDDFLFWLKSRGFYGLYIGGVRIILQKRFWLMYIAIGNWVRKMSDFLDVANPNTKMMRDKS